MVLQNRGFGSRKQVMAGLHFVKCHSVPDHGQGGFGQGQLCGEIIELVNVICDHCFVQQSIQAKTVFHAEFKILKQPDTFAALGHA